MTVDAVSAGAHKLVILAKNQSGEVIDRKEINFTAEPRTTVAQPASRRTPSGHHRHPDFGSSGARARASGPRAARRASAATAACTGSVDAARRHDARTTSTARVQTTLPRLRVRRRCSAPQVIGLILTGLAIRRRS